jgi:hypothetical protein
MSKFKVGDKVRYIKAGLIGWESMDWAEMAGCVLGREYTISCTSPINAKLWVSVKGGQKNYAIHPDHFELIKNNNMQEFQVTKDRILEAASKCSTAKATLEVLFPEAFEEEEKLIPLGSPNHTVFKIDYNEMI